MHKIVICKAFYIFIKYINSNILKFFNLKILILFIKKSSFFNICCSIISKYYEKLT